MVVSGSNDNNNINHLLVPACAVARGMMRCLSPWLG